MQATTGVHDGIPQPVLQEADFVLHDPVAFHSPNHVFNPDSDRGHTPIHLRLRGREFSSRRLLLGLDNRDVLQAEALETLILIATAARWHGRARFLCQTLIGRFAFLGVTQEAHLTRLRDHEEVIERVTFLLATVILVWLFRIGRTLDRTFSAIMPNRGMVDPPSVSCVLNIAANSAAVRAGRSSCSAKA